MAKSIATINWFLELENVNVDRIENEYLVLDRPIFRFLPNDPFKSDVVTAIICTKGEIRGSINLQEQIFKAPGLAIVMSEQLIQFDSVSPDFAGLFIIMSKSFAGSLDIERGLFLRRAVLDNPFIPLSNKEIRMLEAFYTIVQRAVNKKDNPFRLETIRCLTKAFYYSWGYDFHKAYTEKEKSKREQLLEEFLILVQSNYKKYRGLDFYSKRMRLTPKHLSKVIKEFSNKSAAEWIDSYVILESKALLKSTNLTIQQISDELNFPSQSFFGKYFKRHTGVSPSEYKHQI
ncbi:MAG: helix-turn-helix domain-containing protein [Bacteroidota bacterium]|nr:helix-turn-helix domain-containing protein [Bacteroidota bacterium]